MTKNNLFEELSALITESRNPDSYEIDVMGTVDVVRLFNSEDMKVSLAVEKEIPYIAQAVEIITEAFKKGGRLIYVGAGTSGRLGVLDAAECPPTFGVETGMVIGRIAGGYKALSVAVEGYEDYPDNGVKDIVDLNVSDKDVVCGIAASRRTPYVIGALAEAKRRGAKTITVVCNPREHLQYDVDVAICPVPGPEVIMGSTRLKSATAQKMVLNMLTSISMIKIGKVYENMMIDLQLNNKKLVERSKKIIMLAADVNYDRAAKCLDLANEHVKTAIFIALTDTEPDEAKKFIDDNDGFLKKALNAWRETK
ncbi:MAG: N-acetylmuramic acid 6-phosphate etherase [Calditrichales bacterium]|nr:N-acetylmuramic acid 6-phosphate etherase [Calditrichales bacterium]